MSQSRARSVALCGLSIALLAVGAFITVPFGPVPFTLQTLMLLVVVLTLTPGESLVAVSGYLLLGAVGMPVGAGFKGGIAWLLGPTGGFLFGFLAATILIAVLRLSMARLGRSDARPWGFTPQTLRGNLAFALAAALILEVTYYSCGVAWFCVVVGTDLTAALAACVLPFVVPDALKVAIAVICVQPVFAALGRAPWTLGHKDGVQARK
jgi:biotin transport system substrate-specific component